MKFRFLASALVLSLSSSAFAGSYIGVGFGQADYDVDDLDIDEPSAYSLFVGHRVSENLAAEAFYTELSTETSDDKSVALKTSSMGFGVLGGAQIHDRVNLFVNVGLHSWSSKASTGIIPQETDNGTDIFYGVGATANINEQFSAGLRYTTMKLDESDAVDVALINVQLNF